MAAFLLLVIACLSYAGISVVRRLGVRRNLVALPNERSLHSSPTPHGAGLVIVIICVAAYPVISYFALNTFSWGYFAGACFLAVISYIDDVFHLGFLVRLLAQATAAVLLIVDQDTWHGVTMLGGLQLGVFAYAITFVWIVWMINAFNFMDGIDGLAGLQALITAASWLVTGYMLNMPALYIFSGVIAASSFGFLLHNWPPATIFMGDVGSAFLGYTFAALPLLARHMASNAWDLLPIAAALFVWFFLFDSVVTRARRLLRGENVLEAHREHLFQRLVASGLTHRTVTVFYGGLATLLSVSVIVSIAYREEIGLAMFPVVAVLTAVLLGICWQRGVLFGHID